MIKEGKLQTDEGFLKDLLNSLLGKKQDKDEPNKKKGILSFARKAMLGEAITDTIALNGTSTVAGVKAFKTVASISLPVYAVADTETVSVGISDKLGLQSIPLSTSVISEDSGNAADSGGAILTRDADEVEKCVVDPTTECDAGTDKVIVYISDEKPKKVGGYTQ